MDGQPLPTGQYPHYVTDAGQAQALGVIATPALFLVRPEPRDILPLGQGALSLDQLAQRMLLLAAARGWITPTDYQRTRPLHTDRSLLTAGTEIPVSVLEDPVQLVAWLRQQAAQGETP
ncbi:MAG: conjugal transfer protein TraF [Candidatus Competibacteraceae bacterium]